MSSRKINVLYLTGRTYQDLEGRTQPEFLSIWISKTLYERLYPNGYNSGFRVDDMSPYSLNWLRH